MWADVLHSFYRRQVIISVGGKLYRTWVRWYRAPEGARQLPIPNAILADPWEAERESWGLTLGRWLGPRVWDRGRNDAGYQGQCYVGDPAWYRTLDLPGWVIGSGGRPPPAPLPQPMLAIGMGGLVLGGSALPMQHVHAAATGGLVLGGSAAVPAAAATGGLVLAGSAVGSYGEVSMAGQVVCFAGPTIPAGWLECDGSAVSRSTYAALFAAIGTVWGAGDGSTTFNVPDLRGRAAIGVGTGPGLGTRSLGETGGEETHTLDPIELPSYALPVTDTGHAHAVASSTPIVEDVAGNLYVPGGGSFGAGFVIGTDPQTTGISVASGGGGGGHPNMQPYAALHWIIQT